MGSHRDGLGTVQEISDTWDLSTSSPGKRKHQGCSRHACVCLRIGSAGRKGHV